MTKILKSKDSLMKISLRSYDCKLLDFNVSQIVKIMLKNGVKIIGPFPFPVKKKRFCVLRSPHIYKDHKEHFVMNTYTRKIWFVPNSSVMSQLSSFGLSMGVDVELDDSGVKK